MRAALLMLTVIAVSACGGGSGVSNTPPPAAPPVPTPTPPPPTDPTPSSFFMDASASLPDSRNRDCFDALAVDLDTDGDLDLALAGFGLNGADNVILLNDGNALFTDVSATHLPSNSEVSEHVTSADFDMDGDPDLVFANVSRNNSDHEYYLNTGVGGVMAAAPALPVTGQSAFVVAEDFDNDNDPDLFIGNFGLSNLLVNDSFGGFTDESDTRLPRTDAQITEDSGIGDVNGDSFVDIVVAYRGSNTEGEGRRNQVWLNNGFGVFTDATASNMPSGTNSTFDIALADVDNDGDLDAIVGNATIGNSNAPLLDNLLINDGNGVFTDETAQRWPQNSLSNTYGISTLDIDGDGDLDILTAENLGASGDGTVRAYENDGTGRFTEQTNTLIGDVRGNMVDIEVHDFNGDGIADLYFCATRNFGTAESARDFLFLGL
ncbi:MAG: VCBS repeat-containing protein [Pseudomonadota bacterium]